MTATTRRIVKIIPAEATPGRANTVFGTKVLLDDGSEIANITRLVLVADPETGVWKASLEVFPEIVGQLDADLVSVTDSRHGR